MATLAVKVDHVATLREARKTNYPDPVEAAVVAELAGADGIIAHLRDNRRHIQERDIKLLRDIVKTKLILEMTPSPEMVGIALNLRPDLVILAPERLEELTTEGGFDLIVHKNLIAETVNSLQDSGIQVSVSVDPDLEQLRLAHMINVKSVEIHTGTFCNTTTPQKQNYAFDRIINAVKMASKLKMNIAVGHDLSFSSIKNFKSLPEIDVFHVGYGIISRSMLIGMETAVKEVLSIINNF